MNYTFIDSGHQRRLEKFGPYLISRPCATALWEPTLPRSSWEEADAIFTREESNRWILKKKIAPSWVVELGALRFKIAMTDFGHLGLFPEHQLLWEPLSALIAEQKRKVRVLNLFAYSGAGTLAFAKAGAEVCHVDASHPMVALARENAALNDLSQKPIRWIVDDVMKFLKREEQRKSFYDAIMLDPPSFGRGSKKEVFKIEEHIIPLLKQCRNILTDSPLFIAFSSHTPGMTPLVMHHLLYQMMGGKIESGEMLLRSKTTLDLPLGSYARWTHA
jgi:23S rRNA (cytosine1962-C5)-methyltransferase